MHRVALRAMFSGKKKTHLTGINNVNLLINKEARLQSNQFLCIC